MDSLPYVDATNEDYEQYALALIEAEMKGINPPAEGEIKPIRFRTAVMEHEYKRVEAGDGQVEPTKLSLARASAPSEEKSVERWRAAVQQARLDYEAERLRSTTLEVKKDPGASLLWKAVNGNLDRDMQSTNEALKEQREIVEHINLHRSEDQQKAGKQIQILTTQYQNALHRRFSLYQATEALAKEIEEAS